MKITGCYRLAYLAIVAVFLELLISFGPCLGSKAEIIAKEKSPAVEFPIDCRPYHLRSMKFLLKNFNKCSRELKANMTTDKDYEENIGCAMKCTMRETEYSVKDLVTEDSMKLAIGKVVPKILIEPVKNIMWDKCHLKYGNKLNPDDPKCTVYNEYAFCIQNCIADLIDNELYCMKFEKKPAFNSSSKA